MSVDGSNPRGPGYRYWGPLHSRRTVPGGSEREVVTGRVTVEGAALELLAQPVISGMPTTVISKTKKRRLPLEGLIRCSICRSCLFKPSALLLLPQARRTGLSRTPFRSGGWNLERAVPTPPPVTELVCDLSVTNLDPVVVGKDRTGTDDALTKSRNHSVSLLSNRKIIQCQPNLSLQRLSRFWHSQPRDGPVGAGGRNPVVDVAGEIQNGVVALGRDQRHGIVRRDTEVRDEYKAVAVRREQVAGLGGRSGHAYPETTEAPQHEIPGTRICRDQEQSRPHRGGTSA